MAAAAGLEPSHDALDDTRIRCELLRLNLEKMQAAVPTHEAGQKCVARWMLID
jgi:hypothetical protein